MPKIYLNSHQEKELSRPKRTVEAENVNLGKPDLTASKVSLPLGTSLLLDVVRFVAAVVVVVGHVTQPTFTHRFPSLTLGGEFAVGSFFVLSGFVIQYTVDSRENTWRSYARARLARIYSVLVPAILLTLVLGIVGQRINPGLYQTWADTYSNPWLRSALNLLCLTQGHAQNYILMGNDPLWSLGYEVPFYIVFALLQFAKPLPKWLGLGLCAVLYGGNVLVLFPVWYAGVFLFKYLRANRISALAGNLCLISILPIAAASALARLYWKNHSPSLQSPLANGLLQEFLGGKTVYLPSILGGGAATICLILWADAHLDWLTSRLKPHASVIRTLASGTFSIYLFHYPVLMFLGSFPVYDASSVIAPVLLLIVTVGLCFGLSRFTETRKKAYSRLFGKLF